jgi:hypothetical protein
VVYGQSGEKLKEKHGRYKTDKEKNPKYLVS